MRRWILIPGVVALATAACDDALSPARVAGAYVLAAVNDQALPVTVGDVTYSSGSLDLRSDGTFSMEVHFPASQRAFAGTWTLTGSTVAFHVADVSFTGQYRTVINSEDRVRFSSSSGLVSFTPRAELEIGSGRLTFAY
jgi:hypothetical protein